MAAQCYACIEDMPSPTFSIRPCQTIPPAFSSTSPCHWQSTTSLLLLQLTTRHSTIFVYVISTAPHSLSHAHRNQFRHHTPRIPQLMRKLLSPSPRYAILPYSTSILHTTIKLESQNIWMVAVLAS